MAPSDESAVYVSQSALLDTMAEQSAAECSRIASDARAEADRILQHGRDASAAHREAVWRTVKSEESHRDRMSRQFAHVEADKSRLAARNWAVGEVMRQVREEIDRIVAGPGFPAVLERLLVEALDASSGPVVVEAPEAHAEAVRAVATAHGAEVQDVVRSKSLRDGVAVWNPSKTVRISNTLTSRLSIVEDSARKRIVKGLFTRSD